MPLGLIALAIGAFGIGLTEFVIMGLLPDVANDFAVSEAAAGWLISGYALSVVVGALGLTAATVRLPTAHGGPDVWHAVAAHATGARPWHPGAYRRPEGRS